MVGLIQRDPVARRDLENIGFSDEASENENGDKRLETCGPELGRCGEIHVAEVELEKGIKQMLSQRRTLTSSSIFIRREQKQ